MTTERVLLDRTAVLGRICDSLGLDGDASDGAEAPCRNVLLAGPWGSGKTTILKLLEARAGAEETAYHVLRFSPWAQLGDEDPRRGFLRYLATQVISTTPPPTTAGEAKRAWSIFRDWGERFITDGWGQAAVESIGSIAPGAPVAFALARLATDLAKGGKEPADGDTQPQLPPQGEALRKQLSEVLETLAAANGAKRLLLLVDDLDRTRPEYAVAVLEQLHHLFLPQEGETDWPLSSVWAVNIEVLEQFLYEHYRHQPSFDPTAYLERLFDRRVNVPPLFQTKDSQAPSEPERLWRDSLEKFAEDLSALAERSPERSEAIAAASEQCRGSLARDLADGLSYACVGNLRLYESIREGCVDYWRTQLKAGEEDWDAGRSKRLVEDARRITLILAYPGFRESVALFDGMWPFFVNRLNDRMSSTVTEAIVHPSYRHLDDPNLATLLQDLGALRHEDKAERYVIQWEGVNRLSRGLGDMLRQGF
ncbi:P-loop NTPase fold protein [Engelhardtia mirabilis]|uniref:KAP family P-loop domain protein n=1 Tax=Engelhardtia mirabilis TaxID=2528011 RepID=A0A518BIH9_9BACT|nr:KAP family P-loop domain protein [Planctomycetes bacterium Pla133]QDV01116.1 KAP family P-loop domain protein [Planctomycetes bacterium Pla86]